MKRFRIWMSGLLCLLMVTGMMPAGAAAGLPFADVQQTDWFYNAVDYVYENELMHGTGDGRFSPRVTTTRAMIVTILFRMEGSPESYENPFSDVPEGMWYSQAIAWADDFMIVDGYGDGRFGPNDPITREQMAKILAAYAGYCGYFDPDEDYSYVDLEEFSDGWTISGWAEPWIRWAIDCGLLTGKGNGILDPGGQASRAEIATIFMRFCQMDWENYDDDTDYEILEDLYADPRSVIPQETEIAYDPEEHVYYSDDMLLVLFAQDAMEAEIMETADAVGGIPVGYVPGLEMYQLEVDVSSREELERMAEDLMEDYEWVRYATYDSAVPDAEDVAPTVPADPWNGDVDAEDWKDDDVDGSNWSMEAIDAARAWSYADQLQTVEVGVSDNVFDVNHEDLAGRCEFPSGAMEDRNDPVDHGHGTHVAGIIGATPNNGRGMTGVAWNSRLLVAPFYEEDAEEFLWWDSSTYSNLAELVEYGAKVVNFSQGKTNFLSADNRSFSADMIRREGNFAAAAMAQLLDQGHDFVVVQSAGNGMNISTDQDQKITVPTDALQNGWFASITDTSETGSGETSVQDVLSRVLIVGAAEKRAAGGYQCASFSNYGSQVSICAPGVEIYSCVPPETNEGNAYASWSGTSMAAPIVSGVCAMVWGADEELSGAAVKELVCSNTDTRVLAHPNSGSTRSYRMVDAYQAVEEAFVATDVILYVRDEGGSRLGSASITIQGEQGTYYPEMEYYNGGYSYTVRLPRNHSYQVTVGHDGYETVQDTIYPTTAALEKTYTLQSLNRSFYGTVRDSQSRSVLSGVTIRYEGEGLHETLTSDSTGSYKSGFLRPGDYTVTFEKSGYETQTFEMHVEESDRIFPFDTVYLKKDTASISPETALRDALRDIVRTTGIMQTYDISATRVSNWEFRPKWTASDLTGALTADIRDYDADGQSELLVMGYSTTGSRVSLWLSMYEYDSSSGTVRLRTKKTVDTNTSLTTAAIASDQINCFTYPYQNRQKIAVDVHETENGWHRTLTIFEYDGTRISCTGGLGLTMPGEGGAHILERVTAEDAPLYVDLHNVTGYSGWQKNSSWDVPADYDYSGTYAQYQAAVEATVSRYSSLIARRYGLTVTEVRDSDDSRTAQDVYRVNTGSIHFLSMVHNDSRWSDSGGGSWTLLRRDLPGALDAFRG